MLKLGYIMSRFPKITETFILYEMMEIERLGAEVEIYPLLRERQAKAHPDAMALSERAHFHPFISGAVIQAHWHFLRHRPRTYVNVLVEVLRGTLGSLKFFIGAVVLFPKAVRFAYEMQRDGVQHVHAHFATHPTVAALIVHRLTGIPFSFTGHGSDLHVDRRMLKEKVAAAAFAVTVSRFNKGVIVQSCGEAVSDKIHVVHCGVDRSILDIRARQQRTTGESFRMICIASFEEVKGHRYLIEACRLLRERGFDFECRLVGDGPLRRDIERQIWEARLAETVVLCGSRTRPEITTMLSESDAMVLASVPTAEGKREGIPVALMEGMACGLPVVASNLSGIPELVENGISGLLVPPRDAAALANAIETMAESLELRNSLGSAAREKVLREFDLHANAARLMTLFEACAKNARDDSRWAHRTAVPA